MGDQKQGVWCFGGGGEKRVLKYTRPERYFPQMNQRAPGKRGEGVNRSEKGQTTLGSIITRLLGVRRAVLE